MQTADGYSWTSPEGVTGFLRAALPDSPAALPTERNSHAAVAIDSDLLVLGGESNAELVQEMCMIDTEKQVQHSCHQLSSSCKIIIGIAMMSLVFSMASCTLTEDEVDAVLL